MIVDDGGDARHESQSCRHVQVQVEGLAEPGNKHHIKTEKLEPNEESQTAPPQSGCLHCGPKKNLLKGEHLRPQRDVSGSTQTLQVEADVRPSRLCFCWGFVPLRWGAVLCTLSMVDLTFKK